MTKATPAPVRIRNSVQIDPATGCWNWTKYLTPDGYGKANAGGGRHGVLAHRWAYETFVGPIPDGLTLDHLCRNRACCNPEHLDPVTMTVNIKRGSRATKTHCKHGHEFTPENTLRKPNGTRKCRECKNAHARAARRRHK